MDKLCGEFVGPKVAANFLTMICLTNFSVQDLVDVAEEPRSNCHNIITMFTPDSTKTTEVDVANATARALLLCGLPPPPTGEHCLPLKVIWLAEFVTYHNFSDFLCFNRSWDVQQQHRPIGERWERNGLFYFNVRVRSECRLLSMCLSFLSWAYARISRELGSGSCGIWKWHNFSFSVDWLLLCWPCDLLVLLHNLAINRCFSSLGDHVAMHQFSAGSILSCLPSGEFIVAIFECF